MAIRLDGNNAFYQTTAGYLLLPKDYDKALSLYKASRVDPNNFIYYYNRWTRIFSKNDHENAEFHLLRTS